MKLFSSKKKSSTSVKVENSQTTNEPNHPATSKNAKDEQDNNVRKEDKVESKSALNDILTEDDLLKIPLDQLNSKQRRLLRRKLKRDQEEGGGEEAAKEATKEATKEAAKEGAKEGASKPGSCPVSSRAASSDVPKKKGAIKTDEENLKLSELDQGKLLKKLSKKGGVNAGGPSSGKKAPKDFSKMKDIPPEERLRREKQREAQKAAAERRKKESSEGVSVSHAHPLNSERRRANKRKPSESMKIAAAKKRSREERGG
ncbi:hypothetical protein TrRE_jg5217, partial [Triparma retinervis]